MRRACLAVATIWLLTACEDAKAPQRREPHAVEEKTRHELLQWLSLLDRVDPAVWLVGKERGRQPSPTDASVERMRRALDEAKAHFQESPRMLANRTAQLGDMLKVAGMSEDYAELVESLSRVASVASGKQTFGELCQHYFNLRRQGRDRAAALADLTERYGAQTPRK